MLHVHGGIGWDMECSNMPKQGETTMVGMREAMRCSGSNVRVPNMKRGILQVAMAHHG